MLGKLYIVATPIGNLEDITFRAIKILEYVDVIAAEDTRHTLKLLNHYNISKPLISYYRHNENIKTNVLIDKLKKGENIALVSDAGTPGICDPGEIIIRKAIEENIEIIPIPGACAMINALICSGIDTKEFVFLGFLPINNKLRKSKLDEISKMSKTIIMYEAPHKLARTLFNLKEVLGGDRKIVLAHELTKIHEQFIRGSIQEILSKIQDIKGEFVIVVEAGQKIKDEAKLGGLSLEEEFNYYKNLGFEKKDIIKKIAKNRGLNKNDIYMKFLNK